MHNNREFQRYALEHGIYFAPVDDVSNNTLRGSSFPHLLTVPWPSRTRSIASSTCMGFST